MSGNGRFERLVIVYAVKSKRRRTGSRSGSRIASGRERSRPATLDGRDSARCGSCDVRLLVYAERVPQWADLSTPRGYLLVLVASDSAGRSQGLSHRDDLPGDGMLLQWNGPGRHPIWMAGTRFPLDLIWLEQDGRVTGVLTNVPVCSVPACPMYEPEGTQESVAVLELAAGTVATLGIEPGFRIRGLPNSSSAR
jgi:uncharacterized membrane protein (UPF0127 family)